MLSGPRIRSVSLAEFALAFIPFGLLLALALVAPEASDKVLQNRIAYTIWLATVLLIPGLSLYCLPPYWNGERQANLSLLFVTAAYLSYMVHFYLTTFEVFGGIAGIFRNMRLPIAIINVTVTIWWTIHLALAWFAPRGRRWLHFETAAFYTFLFLVFVITDFFLRPTFVRYLGGALAISVVLSLLLRLGIVLPRAPTNSAAHWEPLPELPGLARARFMFAAVCLILLLVAAHGAAELLGARDLRIKLDYPNLPVHTTLYYRIIFTAWSAIILLTPALMVHLLTRPRGQNSLIKGLWTAAYAAFVVHLFWTIAVMFRFDFNEIFHSQIGVAKNPERVVQNPLPDLLFAGWWTLDILLLWLYPGTNRLIKLQHGALLGFAFTIFFGAFVLAEKASLVAHLLGVTMAILVVGAFVIRVIAFEADRRSFLMLLYVRGFQFVNLLVPWYKLPTWLAVINLGALREVLRAKNLHNTSDIPVTRPEGARSAPPFDAVFYTERNKDGYYNDLSKPGMGVSSASPGDDTASSDFTKSAPGARFGRNIPLSEVGPLANEKLLEPNPRLISSELLARPGGEFTPATTLNLLAAAWIQFQTHDWFNHGTPVKGREFPVPLPPGDNWHEAPMKVRRTRPDPTRQNPETPYPDTGPADGQVATYANAETHWWDGSEIYGSSLAAATRLRSHRDGKLQLSDDGNLPEICHMEQTGLSVNWWLGLSLLHNLFAREHNAICDYLLQRNPQWKDKDDQLYRVARLVNTALIAKIHTVDWTPAILGHPALQIGMRANWWGLLTEHVKKALGRLSENESFSGIPGSETDHHTGDYCLTEEFASVYRMHPLMPEGIELRSVNDGRLLRNLKLGSPIDEDPDDMVGPLARDRLLANGSFLDALYSFGVAHPGALVLRNYPTWMRRLRRLKNYRFDEFIDLATIDIVRDRERGVPRYNRFRRLFHLPEFESLDDMIRASKQLREDPALAEALRHVYRNDINQVDLMIGMFAETPPEGFGFSDTAFRVFILMASRRLKSDRFLSKDFTPEVYTQAGLDWVENNNMTSVLLRHYPELAPALRGVSNPFGPWNRFS